MNELLQKHGCSNVFSVPEGLKELMSDITREVLREQPPKLFDFIANYLSVLLLTREHGVMAVKVLDDLCDCRPSVHEHLLQIGIAEDQANDLAQIIKEEIEQFEPEAGNEKIKEMQIMKRILTRLSLDEAMASNVCQVARNAYKDYWYRKKTLELSIKTQPDQPWEIAAQRTLEIYKSTKPSFTQMNRAAERIQAAYRGYHLRRNLLKHLKPKKKGPKVDLPGPPLDIGGSREIDLGPVVKLSVPTDNVRPMFVEHATQKLGLPYDPMMTITHVPEDQVSIASGGSRPPEDVRGRDSRPGVVESNIIPGTGQVLMTATVKMNGPTSVVQSIHKISFAEVSPEVIPDFQLEFSKEPDAATASDGAEQEIPETIADDMSEEDRESVPLSAPSTAPDSASMTDVEDEGDNALASTDEEAG